MARKPPKLHPVCPASAKHHIHNYSLKTLTAVKFLEEKDEKTKHGEPQRICPSCKKVLSNSIKAMRKFIDQRPPPAPPVPHTPVALRLDLTCDSGETMRSRRMQAVRG